MDLIREIASTCETNGDLRAGCAAAAIETRGPHHASMACDAGSATGCVLAVLLGDPDEPDAGEVDARRARRIASAGAAGHPDDPVGAAYMYGYLMAFGIGGPRDATEASRGLGGGCSRGEPAACALRACLDVAGSTDARMRSLEECVRRGAVPDHLVELAKLYLVKELVEAPRRPR